MRVEGKLLRTMPKCKRCIQDAARASSCPIIYVRMRERAFSSYNRQLSIKLIVIEKSRPVDLIGVTSSLLCSSREKLKSSFAPQSRFPPVFPFFMTRTSALRIKRRPIMQLCILVVSQSSFYCVEKCCDCRRGFPLLIPTADPC